MPHQQCSSFLVGVKYYSKEGQPKKLRLRWRLMPLAFYQCLILAIPDQSLLQFVLTNDLQTREIAFADDLTVAGNRHQNFLG